jgi:hypothetical protein
MIDKFVRSRISRNKAQSMLQKNITIAHSVTSRTKHQADMYKSIFSANVIYQYLLEKDDMNRHNSA